MARIRIGFGILTLALAGAFAALVLLTRRSLETERDEARFALASQVIARVDAHLTDVAHADDLRALMGERFTREPSALGYFERYPDGKLFSPAGLTNVIRASFARPEPARGHPTIAPGATVRLPDARTAVPISPQPRTGHPSAYDIIAALASARPAAADRNRSATHTAHARPLAGMRVDDDTILLFRAIVGGPDRMHAEGIVIDLAALERQVTDSLGAAARHIELDLTAGGTETLALGRGPIVVHRLGAPFDAVLAGVAVGVLPGAGGSSMLYGLLALAGVALALALGGSYWASAIAVRDAERRSRFATLVTHELRTPLTAIRMSAEILEQGVLATEPERRSHYRALLVESERLSRLVEGVLELARLRRGGRELRLVPGNLSEVVADARGPLEHIAAQRGFALDVAIEAGLPPVLLERDAVIEVLQNLVDNAVRHGEGTMRVVRVACGHDARSGVIALRVRDHGAGVPRHRLAHLFDGGEVQAGSNAGLGIGLALVRELSVRMGATVSAALPADGGLEITVAFPVARGAEAS